MHVVDAETAGCEESIGGAPARLGKISRNPSLDRNLSRVVGKVAARRPFALELEPGREIDARTGGDVGLGAGGHAARSRSRNVKGARELAVDRVPRDLSVSTHSLTRRHRSPDR